MADLRQWRTLTITNGKSEQTFYDDKLAGLGLRLRQRSDGSVSKSWTLEYRMKGSTVKEKVTYGDAGEVPAERLVALQQGKAEVHDFPVLCYEVASIRWHKDAADIKAGKDPAHMQRERKAKAALGAKADTVREALDKYYDRELGAALRLDGKAVKIEYTRAVLREDDGRAVSEGFKRDRIRRLERWVAKSYDRYALKDFAVMAHVVNILDAAKAAGNDSALRKLHQDMKALFAFLQTRGLIPASPMPPTKRQGGRTWGRDGKRRRALGLTHDDGSPVSGRDDDKNIVGPELPAVIAGMMAESYPAKHVALILLITGLRESEACLAPWSEINFEARTWIIPADRTKNGAGHVLPLTDLAIAVLQDARRHASDTSPEGFIFSTRRGVAYSGLGSAWTDTGERRDGRYTALCRIVDAAERKLEGKRMAPWSPHSLRHTVKSHLSRLDVSHDDSEAVLNHIPPGLKGQYDHWKRLPGMRKALDTWCVELVRLGAAIEPMKALPAPMKALPAPAGAEVETVERVQGAAELRSYTAPAIECAPSWGGYAVSFSYGTAAIVA